MQVLTKKFLSVKKQHKSKTTYNTSKKFQHLINAITSFSNIPLTLCFYFGLIVCFVGLGFIIYLIILSIFYTPPAGYVSIIATITLFSGVIILFLGLQGIYLSKIFTEVKRRPYTIIKNIYEKII